MTMYIQNVEDMDSGGPKTNSCGERGKDLNLVPLLPKTLRHAFTSSFMHSVNHNFFLMDRNSPLPEIQS